MQKDKSWKKADYPNAKPKFHKTRKKDPLDDWAVVREWFETMAIAKDIADYLKRFQNCRVKIVLQHDRFYRVYYQKKGNI